MLFQPMTSEISDNNANLGFTMSQKIINNNCIRKINANPSPNREINQYLDGLKYGAKAESR